VKANMSPGFRGLRQLRAAIFDPVSQFNDSFGGVRRKTRRKVESAKKQDMQPIYEDFRGKLVYVVLLSGFFKVPFPRAEQANIGALLECLLRADRRYTRLVCWIRKSQHVILRRRKYGEVPEDLYPLSIVSATRRTWHC